MAISIVLANEFAKSSVVGMDGLPTMYSCRVVGSELRLRMPLEFSSDTEPIPLVPPQCSGESM